jgi:D-hexose-6-phosphate mutarotase
MLTHRQKCFGQSIAFVANGNISPHRAYRGGAPTIYCGFGPRVQREAPHGDLRRRRPVHSVHHSPCNSQWRLVLV